MPKSQDERSIIAPLRVVGLCPFLSPLILYFTAPQQGDGAAPLSSTTTTGLYVDFTACAKAEYNGTISADRTGSPEGFEGQVGGWWDA